MDTVSKSDTATAGDPDPMKCECLTWAETEFALRQSGNGHHTKCERFAACAPTLTTPAVKGEVERLFQEMKYSLWSEFDGGTEAGKQVDIMDVLTHLNECSKLAKLLSMASASPAPAPDAEKARLAIEVADAANKVRFAGLIGTTYPEILLHNLLVIYSGLRDLEPATTGEAKA